jgi:lipase
VRAGVSHWGDGPRNLLMLHCSLAQGAAWKGVAAALPGGLALIAPDLVGHGHGPAHDASRNLHDQCHEAVLPYLPQSRFDAVGHSFGATLALRLAVEMPDRISSLTLIEPVLFAAARGSGTFTPHQDAETALGMAVGQSDGATATRKFLRLWGSGEDFDDLPAHQRDYMVARLPLIDASRPTLFDDSAALVARLGQVVAPTLLMAGGDCLPVITAILDRMERDMPDTMRMHIPGAGHMAPITHPAPVASAIAAHLARVNP